jgi:hypothetical protein
MFADVSDVKAQAAAVTSASNTIALLLRPDGKIDHDVPAVINECANLVLEAFSH